MAKRSTTTRKEKACPSTRESTTFQKSNGHLLRPADLLEIVSDAVISTDTDFNIVSWNRAAEDTYGWRADQVAGKPVAEVTGIEYPYDSTEDVLKRFAETGRWSGEVVQRRKDGSRINVMASVTAVRDENGNPVGAVAVNRDITERKRAEEALQESEALFRTIFDSAAIGIGLVDSGGRTLRMNPALQQLLGYTVEELRGMTFEEYMHPEDATVDVPLFEEMLAGTRDHYQVEKRFVKKDGQTVWGRMTLSAVHHADGGFRFAIGMVEDVTQKRLAEEALRQSEEKFRSVVERANELIVIVQDEAIQYANPQAMGRLGYRPDEVLGKSVVEFVHPDKVEEAIKRYQSRLAGKPVPLMYETVLVHKDGTSVHAEVSGGTITYNGRPADMVILRDMTERKQAEEDLQRKERYFRALIDNSLDAISILNADGSVRYRSPSHERVTGYRSDERSSDNMLELLHPDDRESVARSFAQLLRDPGGTVQVEARALHKDGTWRTLETAGHNLLHEPAVEGVVVNFRDITDRKRAEEELKKREKDNEEQKVFLESIYEGVTSAIFVADVMDDGGFRYSSNNASHRHGLGFKPGEIIGKTPEDLVPLIPPETAAAVRANYRRCVDQGKPIEYDEMLEIGGHQIWVSTRLIPLLDSDGHTWRIIGVSDDITERKRAGNLVHTQRDLGVALSMATGLDEGLRRCLEAALRASEMDCGGVYLVDEATGALELRLHAGLPEDFVASASHFDTDSPNAQLVMQGEPVYAVHKGLEIPVDEMKQREALRAIAILPVRHEGRVIACLNVASHSVDKVPAFARDALEAIAGQVGSVIARLVAEEALRRERDNLVNMLEAMEDGVYIIGQGYELEYANQALQRTFGPPEGRKCYECFHDRHEPCAWCKLESVLAGETVRWEWYSVKEGRTYELVETPMRNLGGTVSKLAILRDITERKRMEEELITHRYNLEELVSERTSELTRANERLHREITERTRMEREVRESEERFRAIAETTPIPIVISRVSDGTILYVNETLRTVFNAQQVELTGRTTADFFGNDTDRQAVRDVMQRNGYVRAYELPLKKADGTLIWVAASSQPMMYQGEQAYLSGLYDITERRRMEEELRNQEAHFRSLIENSMEVIAVLNSNGTVRYESPSIEAVTGYKPGERLGGSIFDMIHPDDIAKVTDEFSRLLHNPSAVVHVEVRGTHKDGSYRWIEASGQNLLDDPAVKGIVVNYRDIAERKQADLKLQEAYEDEKALRSDLEDEMTKRVEFTRALAHELKTPLTPVMISSQTLVSQLKEEPLASLAKNVSRGASNLDARIDELLDLAKGEIGMLRLQPRPMQVRHLLEEAIEDVANLASSRGQSIAAELPDSLPRVRADEARLRQVVMNLLNNALKFTPEGGKVTLRARDGKSNLVVEVQDTGPGIPRRDQQRIFDPYHRRESDRERMSGLGLGLALCKSLVGLHGGHIWVKSRPGKGSTFGFSLPVESRN